MLGYLHNLASSLQRTLIERKNLMQKPASSSLTGPALIATAAILWALDGMIRRSLFTLPATTIVFFEHLIGVALILPFVWPWLRDEVLKGKVERKVWGRAAVVALFSSVLGTLWFTMALSMVNFIPFSVVFLIQKLQPLFALSSAYVLLKEKLNWKYGVWAVVALVAAYFVTFPGGVVNLSTGAGTVTAALLALGAAIAWGSGTTLSKMLLSEVDQTKATFMRFGLATVFALVAAVVMGQSGSLMTVSGSQVARFAAIAVSTGMVALWIYYKGLRQTPVRVSTIVELTFPMLAIAIDGWYYGVWLSASQLVAAGVLLVAMYMVARVGVEVNAGE
jgi:DME family drug/metabolite transporter